MPFNEPDQELDFFTRCDIETSFKRGREILDTGIFKPENCQHPLVRSAFIELLIVMRDLMFKTEKHASRISFQDDVHQFGKVQDVTGLIKHVRDAICHPDSDNHYIEKGNIKATFNVAYGKCLLAQIGERQQSSDYDDDVCFFFGLGQIYLNRHIIRAFREAEELLYPLLERRPG